MKKDPKETLKEMLRERGLKATPPRAKILSVFSKECHPMNAEAVHKALSAKIDLVTIYRTLASFEAADILKKVDLHKDSVYYELNHHHHHIICTSCGYIEGFEACDIEKLAEKTIARSSQFKEIKQHSLEFFGVCKGCVKG